MTLGYNADIAFGQSTAEMIDYAKSPPASLTDKRDESEVDNIAQETMKKMLTFGLGDSPSTHIHRPVSRRDCGEASMLVPEVTT